jgi:hypothetical protein
MSTEDYKKRHNEYTKKESQTLITQFAQKKKKREALEDKSSKRLQSEFYPEEVCLLLSSPYLI